MTVFVHSKQKETDDKRLYSNIRLNAVCKDFVRNSKTSVRKYRIGYGETEAEHSKANFLDSTRIGQ